MLRCTSTISKLTNQMYAYKSYVSSKFKGAISQHKGVLFLEESFEEIIEAPISLLFSTMKMRRPSRPDGFLLCGKMVVVFFFFSDLHYTIKKLGDKWSKPNLISMLLEITPTLALGSSIARFTLVVLVSRTNTLRKERILLHKLQ